MTPHRLGWMTLAIGMLLTSATSHAQFLDAELQRAPLPELVAGARQLGDAARGAVAFHQPSMACGKCHLVGSDNPLTLGPDLSALGPEVSDESIVESVLYPSKVIRKGYESVTVLKPDGQVITGLLVERTEEQLVVRDVARAGESVSIPSEDIEQVKTGELSIMPAGQMNQLTSRQQFFDLIRYLIEIRDGGAERARQLQPSASLLIAAIPEYEGHLDHAGLIGTWNDDAFQRGEAIYRRVCANCHGTHEQPGSLPTSLRFADGKFKNGSDPLSMYRTLTHGFGQMAPQSWMVPSQKYDVIHYIRRTYLETHNPTQLVEVDSDYLASLPRGDTFGPEPSNIEAWSAMDYGPSLTHTYEVPGPHHNFAYKGIAIRLDPGAGGVSRGGHWMVFDTDTLRVAAGWHASPGANSQNRFIDWRSIQFNGEHGVHPRVVGQVAFTNPTGPGWANPSDSSFRDDRRVLGRDGRQYGPLPRPWGQFRGLYHHDQQVILAYTVGASEILEMPRLSLRDDSAPLLLRTFNIGPRPQDLILQVAQHPDADSRSSHPVPADLSAIRVAEPNLEASDSDTALQFDGETFVEIADADAIDMNSQDFSIVARLKTQADGTIFSLSDGGESWIPNGQSFFVRGGRLSFDIGWVGAVNGRSRVDDGQWHQVAVTWEKATSRVRLLVDGRLDGEGTLAAKAPVPKPVARIGFTSPNFPQPASFFRGDISRLHFYPRCVSAESTDFEKPLEGIAAPLGAWSLAGQLGSRITDATGQGHDGTVRRGLAAVRPQTGPLLAGFAPRDLQAQWLLEDGNLRLRIPAGDQPLRFTVWIASSQTGGSDVVSSPASEAASFEAPSIPDAALDLATLTQGGPPRWSQTITTQASLGADDGPFAADLLTAPEPNPWLALTRFTGLDIYPDGRIAICTWDGDVWLVRPRPEGGKTWLDWRRIASGLFQPLGLKIVQDKIHVICRDQLTVLRDLNGDGEIDFYQCLNNDHQVTEHFHEFAMGLQTDALGNFYYAKSGCHGKAAVVPHHGTLLKVDADGSKTEILANGFRAANGVCLNPDGSFVVTDQEGFWNPKNRINWVTLSDSGKPNFYGNMLGYHDVDDESDSAMVQPLCWITNAFDRSPAELLWVDSPKWGPLHGSLLNLSYGYGKVFLVPHEKVGGFMQGGMIELPIPSFPTGVMRGRFHPGDGQLYLCGMFAWAGNATHPGGLYRLRATGEPMHLPVALRATKSGMKLTFTEALDPASVEIKKQHVKTWSLKRTANYGSKHYDEKSLEIRGAKLSADSKTLSLDIADLQPTWCMEIRFALRSATGRPVQGTIHNTIHALAD